MLPNVTLAVVHLSGALNQAPLWQDQISHGHGQGRVPYMKSLVMRHGL